MNSSVLYRRITSVILARHRASIAAYAPREVDQHGHPSHEQIVVEVLRAALWEGMEGTLGFALHAVESHGVGEAHRNVALEVVGSRETHTEQRRHPYLCALLHVAGADDLVEEQHALGPVGVPDVDHLLGDVVSASSRLAARHLPSPRSPTRMSGFLTRSGP